MAKPDAVFLAGPVWRFAVYPGSRPPTQYPFAYQYETIAGHAAKASYFSPQRDLPFAGQAGNRRP
jgi:hypothetical protein